MNEAVAEVAPSSAGKLFCDGFVGLGERCRVEIDKASCLNLVKLFNDETLDAALECTEKSCTQAGSCVDATLIAPVGVDEGDDYADVRGRLRGRLRGRRRRRGHVRRLEANRVS